MTTKMFEESENVKVLELSREIQDMKSKDNIAIRSIRCDEEFVRNSLWHHKHFQSNTEREEEEMGYFHRIPVKEDYRVGFARYEIDSEEIHNTCDCGMTMMYDDIVEEEYCIYCDSKKETIGMEWLQLRRRLFNVFARIFQL